MLPRPRFIEPGTTLQETIGAGEKIFCSGCLTIIGDVEEGARITLTGGVQDELLIVGNVANHVVIIATGKVEVQGGVEPTVKINTPGKFIHNGQEALKPQDKQVNAQNNVPSEQAEQFQANNANAEGWTLNFDDLEQYLPANHRTNAGLPPHIPNAASGFNPSTLPSFAIAPPALQPGLVDLASRLQGILADETYTLIAETKVILGNETIYIPNDKEAFKLQFDNMQLSSQNQLLDAIEGQLAVLKYTFTN